MTLSRHSSYFLIFNIKREVTKCHESTMMDTVNQVLFAVTLDYRLLSIIYAHHSKWTSVQSIKSVFLGKKGQSDITNDKNNIFVAIKDITFHPYISK